MTDAALAALDSFRNRGERMRDTAGIGQVFSRVSSIKALTLSVAARSFVASMTA